MATTPTFDVTARKFHQIVTVVVLAIAFILSDHSGWVLTALMGVVMIGGRFFWPLDIFRQFVWRVAEPVHLLQRVEVQEDHTTRRIARVLGGAVMLLSALLVAVGAAVAGWVILLPIAVMIALDGLFSFCALCWVTYRFGIVAVQH